MDPAYNPSPLPSSQGLIGNGQQLVQKCSEVEAKVQEANTKIAELQAANQMFTAAVDSLSASPQKFAQLKNAAALKDYVHIDDQTVARAQQAIKAHRQENAAVKKTIVDLQQEVTALEEEKEKLAKTLALAKQNTTKLEDIADKASRLPME